MSSWKKVDRTDDLLTVSFRKKVTKASTEKQKTEEGLKKWTIKDIAIMTKNEREKRRESTEKNGKMSPEIQKLLKELSLDGEMTKVPKNNDCRRDENNFETLDKVLDRNRYFRFYYALPFEPNEFRDDSDKTKSTKSSRKSKSSKTSRTSIKSNFSNQSNDFSNSKKINIEDDSSKSSSSKSTKKLKYKKSKTLVDHNGIPLSHPLATTPFPGALSKKHREKARELLKKLAQRKTHSNGSATTTTNEKKQIIEVFPNRVDAETREKARKALIELANNRSKNNSASCSAENVGNPKQNVTSSEEFCSESNSEVKTKRNVCTHCGTCVDCRVKCRNKHGIVTDKDKKKFVQEIFDLRERIQEPEKTRHCHSRSPFDLTQSSSDSMLNTNKSSIRKSGHR